MKIKFLRFLFFLLLLCAAGAGGLLVMDRLQILPRGAAPLRELPLLNLLLSPGPATESTVAGDGLSLKNVRGYYHANRYAGKILIIEGEVVNLSDRALRRVLVMGWVNDIHRQATVYAGPIFTKERIKQ